MKYQRLRWRSMSTRVTLFVLAIFLTSIWSLMIYVSQRLHKDMELVLREQQYSTVRLLAASINTELESRLQALGLVARGIDRVMLKSPPVLQRYLQDRVLLHPLFNAGVHIVGINGVALADVSNVPNRVGTDFSGNSSIQIALASGKSSVGPPLMVPLLKQAMFPIVVPIFDRNGDVIGAIAGTTNLASVNFLDLSGQTYFGKTGGYLLVAPKQRMIVSASDKSRTMQELPAGDGSFPYGRFLDGYEGSAVVDSPQGASVMASAKAVPVGGWILLATLPTQEAFAFVHSMLQDMLLAATVLTVLAVALTRWMLLGQLAPLTAAADKLMELSGTDQPAPLLTVARQDEIGQLLEAFNRMLTKLGQREGLLKKILDTSSVAIFVVDHEGRITQANERMNEMFGCATGALVGSEYIDLVYPVEREAARKNVNALLAAEIPPVDLNRRFCSFDGAEFWGHLTARHFFNTGTERRALVGVIVDITERKIAQEKLLQHDQRFTAIIENFPGGVSMIDSDLRLVAYNKQFMQLLDFPDSLFEKDDLTLEDLLHFNAQRGEYGPGDVQDQVSSRIERARKFEPHKFERIRPNGQVLEVLGVVVPGGGFVTIYIDITERKQMEEQVRQLAFYDPLTRLPNRRLLNDRLGQAIASSKRSSCYGALLFLDLDNFKSLNDTHGHGAGDLLLIEAASRLTSCVREIDTVARLGGDEFVVVVGDLDVSKGVSTMKAASIAEKIRKTIADPYVLTLQEDGRGERTVEHRCTASIGVVVFNDSEGTQEDFLRWADAAMYLAKGSGSNMIRFSDAQPLNPAPAQRG
jgi:diguanylate cyclase (GGDEF)-like protein/PAS domain S-box-containing protein